MMPDNGLAELITQAAARSGLGWRALAARAKGEVSHSTLYNIATGRHRGTCTGRTLRGIALATGRNLDEVEAAYGAKAGRSRRKRGRRQQEPQEGLSPAGRVLRAQLAAHTLHSRVADPSAHTRPAREAFERRFLEEV